jgi:GT2 family glycosyltransferase
MANLPKVAVHMAVHNRAEYTIRSVKNLYRSAEDFWNLELFVADSGSDDIQQLILETIKYKPYTYIKVPEDSYWAESMYSCYKSTVSSDFDYILLLNNDVFLFENAVEQLNACAHRNPNTVIVGQLWDPMTDSHAYGGLMKSGMHPLRYKSLVGVNVDTKVDSFHGNCVLLPKISFANGLYLNPEYRHNYADLDLGIRLNRLGIHAVVSQEYQGECTVGERKSGDNFFERLETFRSPLGTPIKSQILILKETSGKWLWWIWLIPPVVRLFTGRLPKMK